MVTGQVTGATEMSCETSAAQMQSDDQGSGGDDNSTAGTSGDDNNTDGNSGDDGNEDAGNAATCPTDPTGMTVREAELTVSSAGAVWNKLELIGR
jgi:hypothetical protein